MNNSINRHLPSVSIILPAKNEEVNLNKVFDALKTASSNYEGDVEILLVDNGSSDNTVDIAKKAACKVLIEKDGPVARVRNSGASKALGEVLAFLDADCIVDPNWLNICVNKLYGDGIGVVGTRAIPDLKNATWVEDGWYRLISGAPRPDYPNWIGTSNLLVKKTDFWAVGGFNNELDTAEDIDFCDKIRESNAIYLEKSINTIHLGESNTASEIFRKELWRGKSSLKHFIRSKNKTKHLISLLVPLLYVMIICGTIISGILNNDLILTGCSIILLLPLLMVFYKKALIVNLRTFVHVYLVANLYLIARGVSLCRECYYLLKDFFNPFRNKPQF